MALMRRYDKIDEAILSGEKMVKSNPQGPRLKHSLGLALIARCYKVKGIFTTEMNDEERLSVSLDQERIIALPEPCALVCKWGSRLK